MMLGVVRPHVIQLNFHKMNAPFAFGEKKSSHIFRAAGRPESLSLHKVNLQALEALNPLMNVFR